MKRPKLIPPDPKQCQAERKEGCWPDSAHFMIIGPGRLVRCTNKAVNIVRENAPGKDGRRGSMSLCNLCTAAFIEQFGGDYATLTPIKRTTKGSR